MMDLAVSVGPVRPLRWPTVQQDGRGARVLGGPPSGRGGAFESITGFLTNIVRVAASAVAGRVESLPFCGLANDPRAGSRFAPIGRTRGTTGHQSCPRRVGMSYQREVMPVSQEQRGRGTGAKAGRGAVDQPASNPLIETLEGRQLLAAQLSSAAGSAATFVSAATVLGTPSVAAVRPATGTTAVRRDAFVACDLTLPNGGLNQNTLAGNVSLVRASDGAAVPGRADTSGGGDVIVFTPTALLDANTQYRFAVTAGVKDVAGKAIAPFTSTFTTGTAGGQSTSSVAFAKAAQSAAPSKAYTAVAVGPDQKLYAATYDGLIYRFPIAADGTLGTPTKITTVNDKNGGSRTITGLTFDPTSTAANVIVWVDHSQMADFNGADFTGKVSRLSGPSLATYNDYVVGLPRSVRDHMTNQSAFGPDGALYVSQAASNAMGGVDAAWGNRAEHLLTAAILRVDVKAIGKLGSAVNVKTTDAGGPYNPYAAGAPVTLYATGVRNGYDVVWHSNGSLYTAVNGSAAGGNSPASSNTGLRPDTRKAYAGPAVKGVNNIRETEHDWLFKIQKGGYYGHPNPSRGEFVYNGGNPTSGVDPQEVAALPVGTQPDANFKRAAYDFGQNYSPDGMIEYQSSTFGGALKGSLLVVRYSGGDDIMALPVKADGSIDGTKTVTGALGMTGFNDPVDLAEFVNKGNAADARNGFLYVAEYGGKKITLLRPTKAPAQTGPTLLGLSLMNAATDALIKPFVNNISLDLGGGRPFTVRAEVGSGTIGSVVFAVDGKVVRTESYAPYSIAGEVGTDYTAWTVPTGDAQADGDAVHRRRRGRHGRDGDQRHVLRVRRRQPDADPDSHPHPDPDAHADPHTNADVRRDGADAGRRGDGQRISRR